MISIRKIKDTAFILYLMKTYSIYCKRSLMPQQTAVCRKAGEPLRIEEIMVAPSMPVKLAFVLYLPLFVKPISVLEHSEERTTMTLRRFNSEHGSNVNLVVESVGKDVTEVDKGDVVLPVFISECGEWVGAAWRTADVEPGSTVAIFGLGSIGLAGVGRASLRHKAYASCRKGWGKTIILGSDKPGSMLNISCSEVLVDGKNLMGCLVVERS
ncbi:hypothetical protein VNO78_31788 [Psophocarpus tetragonolobus]|uniref:Uncharacterized protein n=1 Tax=Psophocarpus tetragonolobus TaxID=3891 RepID=A0AAN9RYL4_PSOTE